MINHKQVNLVSKILFISALLIVGLYFLSSLLTPLVFAAIISLLLLPICQKLESWKINRIISILAVLLMSTVLVGIISFFFISQFNNFLEDFPNLQDKIEKSAGNFYQDLNQQLGLEVKDPVSFLQNNSSGLMSSGSKYLSKFFGATSGLISFLTLVPIYCFLLLLYRNKFKNAFLDFFPSEKCKKIKTIIVEIKETVQQYFLGLLIVISIIAVLNSIGLLALGIKYSILLGVFSALLTVIPYVGVVVGGLIPVLIALVTKDSLWYPAGVVGIYWLVQFLEGNLITPKIVGAQVDLNALAVIFGLLAFGQLWGLIGLILAVPIIAVIKVVFSYSENLKPIASMLGK
ncbi:AI-2E family transporter [Flexithrix dorotheae]|uniref:AI-2E family transporter n=1 Tax=Flexithrix dorotheae TaxID=70993 RepID=UPI000361F348|nr:AI-2E family transporter [Flexithrix dorotheae]